MRKGEKKETSFEDELDVNLARVLNAAIRDRDKPQPALCIPAVCFGLVVFQCAPSVQKALRSTYTDLLDTALKFISTPMSEEQIDALERKWSVCRCDLTHSLLRSVHKENDEPRTLSHIITRLVNLVFRALEQVTPTKLVKQAASHGKWPPSPAYLLPRGPQALIDAMLQWTRYTDRDCKYESSPLYYLAKVSEFCPSLQRPIAVSADLLRVFATHFHEAAAAFETLLNAEIDIYSDPVAALDQLLRFYDALSQALIAHTKRYEVEFAPQARTLYPAAERLIKAIPLWDDVIEDAAGFQDKVENMARTFWLALPEDERPKRDWPAWKRAVLSLFDVDSFAYTVFDHWGHENACAGPSCLRPGEYAQAPLRVCQRCKTLRYCSRECQKEHWTWPRAPHKATCDLIGRFWAVLKTFDKPEFDGMNKRDLFYDAVEELKYSWDDAKVAWTALEALTLARDERTSSRALVKASQTSRRE